MSQLDAQLTLMLIGIFSAFVIAIAGVDGPSISKWWWVVPAALIAPIFIHTYISAVLG